ncbi:MAG: hypothetical protein GEV08_19325 [Acidimicrobiia bacterium]|nr:hypothetical protein [Acidimicrobiia bacterium]
MAGTAAAVAVGAWWSPAVPLPAAAGVALVALAWRRPLAVVLAAGLLAAALGHRAWAATAPVQAQAWSGEVVFMGDPEPFASGVRAVVEADGRRVEASAFGGAARRLRPRLAGERAQLEGRLRGPAPAMARRLATRHVLGRLEVTDVGTWRRGALPWSAANGLRRVLERGAVSLPEDERSLLTGLVLGDDRYQSPEVQEDFRAAGLTHLLAVSGQNVAFVLLALAPLLQRLRIRTRLVATIGALAFFAVLTRYEPSVLRATTMAGAAVLAASLGRPASGLRVLALATSALLLVDPLLAHSLGFQLSVLATAGILVLARPVAVALPGPRWLASPLAVTLAAQVATAPLLAATIGPVPLAGLPANLLAGPAAGAVMAYGLVGGLAAGLVPAPLAAVLHMPTRALLWWVAAVARWCAALPLPSLDLQALVMVAAAWALVMAFRRGRDRGRWARRGGVPTRATPSAGEADADGAPG